MNPANVIVIVGPTASGKSARAVKLAKDLGGEIISADSRQVYKGLDIGTGKITRKEMQGVPHHLLDVISPKKIFTVHDFARLGREACSRILQNSKIPIITGGTGFYIDALVGRILVPDVAPDPRLRRRLESMNESQLFALLKRKDPRRAATIEQHNKRRLIRAIEIANTLGVSPLPAARPLYNVTWLGIKPDMHLLEKKIRARLLLRLKKGMLNEARKLHARGLSYKRMEELGLEYRSMARHLKGLITREEMINELSRDIRRYAKHQMMYWKRNKDIQWFSDPKQIKP